MKMRLNSLVVSGEGIFRIQISSAQSVVKRSGFKLKTRMLAGKMT